ncbi:MAG: DUF302 domain-containing protein [Coxiellaceae bacterium]|nr:DUF302 domain-containing protein [Coxiellaceae bacterium]
MKRILLPLVSLLLALTCQWSFAVQQVTGVKTVTSEHSVRQTVQRLTVILRRDNFVVRGLIDHQAIAKSLGHNVNANIEILAGRPDFDYPLINANPMSALFLPMAFVVWEDKGHVTHVSYWDPKNNITPLLDLKNADAIKVVDTMSTRLAKLVSKATEANRKNR